MTDDNTTPHTAGGDPDAAEPILPKRNRMSDDTERKDRAYRQAVERKFEIERLQRELKDANDKIAAITAERDAAVEEVEGIREEYATFTNENALSLRIQELEFAAKKRDVWDSIKETHGNAIHKGVTFDDLLGAAKVDFASLKEIPEDFTTKVIEAAKASKPFLFASSGSADTQPGEVRQETAAQPPQTFKAFGAQAAGGGAAPPAAAGNPVKTVDWKNWQAVSDYTDRNK